MEERGLLNDAETMLCVAVVVKQYLQHAVSTGAREHALLAEITHSLPRRSPELPLTAAGSRGTLSCLRLTYDCAAAVVCCRVRPARLCLKLLVWFFQFLADPSDVEWNKDGKTKLTRAQLFAATVSLVALGLVSILALNAVRVINAVSFDYLLL